MKLVQFTGSGKGIGAGVRTPFEARNTLRSRAHVRFVDLISSGPIEGFCNSAGLTLHDAVLKDAAQPSVSSTRQLYFDPQLFDLEFEGSAFRVNGLVSRFDALANESLFENASTGYPFSGNSQTGIAVPILATFYDEDRTTSLEPSSAQVKTNAQIYLQTYPKTTADQITTSASFSQTAHGFSVGQIVYRARTAANTYEWKVLPEGMSPFSYHVRQITSTATDSFTGVVYPICPEGRARCLYVVSLGSFYLLLPPIANPITQATHGFAAGDMIEYKDGSWVKVTTYTQATASVQTVLDANRFTALRPVVEKPKLIAPSIVGTAVYLDDTPLVDPASLSYNFANVRLSYRLGHEIQEPLDGFDQTETLISSERSVVITRRTEENVTAPVIKDLPVGDWDALAITLMLPDGLYRQDLANGEIHALGDNYGSTGAASSASTNPANQPPVIRISYRMIQMVGGIEQQSAIEYPFGPNDGLVVLKGKTMSSYEFTVEGKLLRFGSDAGVQRWYRLYFRRLSPDDAEYTGGSVGRRSSVVVSAITGLLYTKLSYPFCAVVGIEIDAEQFTSIPTRSYHVKMLEVPVPTNYFPPFTVRERVINGTTYRDYRTVPEYNRLPDGTGVYDEVGSPVDQTWDGSFYNAWSNNPAWLLHFLCTDARVGLGAHMRQINKWLVYQIARYCDELIPTAWNGTEFTRKEPRFACSVYFQTASEAWRVLSDVASSFQGALMFQAGQVVPIQDRPRPVRFQFSPANVVDGVFTYSGMHRSSRYSTAIVSYSNPANRYKQTPVIYQDDAVLARLGWKPIEKAAFGVTSESQARRAARRYVISSNELTDSVRFQTGLLGSVLRPGDVIAVHDPARAQVPFSGRIVALATTDDGRGLVTLDRLIPESVWVAVDMYNDFGLVCQRTVPAPDVTQIQNADDLAAYAESQLTPPLPLYAKSQSPSGTTIIILHGAVPENVAVGNIWGLRSVTVKPATFQVISVEETRPNLYSVLAAEYQSALYDTVDRDTTYTEEPIVFDLDAWKRPQPVANLRIEIWPSVTEDGQKAYKITISWSPSTFAREYRVFWKRGLADYQSLTTTAETTAETVVMVPDNYCVKVFAVGLTGLLSLPSEVCQLIGVIDGTNEEIVSGLELTGLANATLFQTADASFDWRVNWSGATTELQTSEVPVLPPGVAEYEVEIRSVNDLPVYATARKDTSFTFTASTNRVTPDGPHREFIISVRARTMNGGLSKATSIRVRNERPAVPAATWEADTNGYLVLDIERPTDVDFKNFVVWVSDTEGFTPAADSLKFVGDATRIFVAIPIGTASYVRYAALDELAKDEYDCTMSDEFSVVGRKVGTLTVFDVIATPARV